MSFQNSYSYTRLFKFKIFVLKLILVCLLFILHFVYISIATCDNMLAWLQLVYRSTLRFIIPAGLHVSSYMVKRSYSVTGTNYPPLYSKVFRTGQAKVNPEHYM